MQQAVKLADAALKKYKGDQLVRALKGYALYRSGKHDEALQVGGWRRWLTGWLPGMAGRGCGATTFAGALPSRMP